MANKKKVKVKKKSSNSKIKDKGIKTSIPLKSATKPLLTTFFPITSM